MLCIFWLFCTCGYFVKLFYTAGIASEIEIGAKKWSHLSAHVKKKSILAAKLTRNGCNKDLTEGRIRSEKQGCADEILCVVARAF